MREWPRRFLVCGTDTGVGKTLVSAALTLGLGGHYYKPFQTGWKEGTDLEFLRTHTGLDPSHFSPEAYRLQEPLSPDQAAALEGVRIDPNQVGLPEPGLGPLVVEGVGGLMVPLNETDLFIDWAARLALPVLLVARSGLGTLNHTLLSLEALKARNLECLGVVLNGPLHQANRTSLEARGVKVLAQVQPLPQLSPAALLQVFAALSQSPNPQNPR